MLISTTDKFEGREIKEYRGIVFGEVVSGVNCVKDYAAAITNYTGGRATELEKELINARAEKIGGNAIVGVDPKYVREEDKYVDLSYVEENEKQKELLKKRMKRFLYIF